MLFISGMFSGIGALGVDRSENNLLRKYTRMQGGLMGDCIIASSKYY